MVPKVTLLLMIFPCLQATVQILVSVPLFSCIMAYGILKRWIGL